ncbi:hypothetical protein [Pantoea phytobeneficialis]|uniref:Uncharacterized protein n=1 Tax=Pantoea phytobeneficialis TaxID=2052056 RepID=A0ABT8XSM9_9GAMM|nr:hypothetical protein [Pantoea phytobeneficialis]MDO6406462.1 hypothetical protein [Pantoea phytobeneficialis]
MDKMRAVERLNAFDKKGRYVFTTRDLAKIFHEDSPKALNAGLNRLVKGGACRVLSSLLLELEGEGKGNTFQM